jgi:nucleoside-diphosphate-sugar epimerase
MVFRLNASASMPGTSSQPLPARDLDHVLEHTQGLWEELRGARMFFTGGTGFVGRWMVETLLRANDDLGLGAEATVLTRNPSAFAAAVPHVADHPAVRLLGGDVKSFEFPSIACTHVLHLATETALGGSRSSSFDTASRGTSRVLEFAATSGVRELLLTSSGAVYGTQPPDCERLSEEYPGAPRAEDPSAGYGHGKRAAEFLCSVAAAETNLRVKIARCFAFVGPLLPLDANFAIGNFIRDAALNDRIEVAGDGTPRRSYLYAADLAIWLWTILVRGESGRPYNVGSEADLSIAELASLVGEVLNPAIAVHIQGTPMTGVPPARYLPSTARAAAELGLHALVDLHDAVRRTADWYFPGRMHGRRGET